MLFKPWCILIRFAKAAKTLPFISFIVLTKTVCFALWLNA
jgi:hypothetical protein